jgi:hypothetical protein
VARGILRSFVREHVGDASKRLLPVSFAGVV